MRQAHNIAAKTIDAEPSTVAPIKATVSSTSRDGFTRRGIASVVTLGQVFKRSRRRRQASLIDAELATKVSGKYLTALEQGAYCDLPADVYAAGFVRRYAEWLSLDTKACVERYRRERTLAETAAPNKSTRADTAIVRSRRPLTMSRLWITPERFIGLIASAFVLAFVGYLWFQVKSFAAAPPLDLTNAVNNQVVKVDTLTLSGSTDAQATLAVNGQTVPVDAAGRFTATIHLVDGVNTIEIKAQNQTDQQTTKVLKVLAALDDAKAAAANPGPELPVAAPAAK